MSQKAIDIEREPLVIDVGMNVPCLVYAPLTSMFVLKIFLGRLFFASGFVTWLSRHRSGAGRLHPSVSSITQPLCNQLYYDAGNNAVCYVLFQQWQKVNRDHQPALTRFIPHSFMRASLSLNPKSFANRFALIPCAAGDLFQAVDVNMHSPQIDTIVDWGTSFVSPSQENADDDPGDHLIRCRNCRFFVFLIAHMQTTSVLFSSYTVFVMTATRLD